MTGAREVWSSTFCEGYLYFSAYSKITWVTAVPVDTAQFQHAPILNTTLKALGMNTAVLSAYCCTGELGPLSACANSCYHTWTQASTCVPVHGIMKAIDKIHDKPSWCVGGRCLLFGSLPEVREETFPEENHSTLPNISRHCKTRQIHLQILLFYNSSTKKNNTFLLLHYFLLAFPKISMSLNVYITRLLRCHINSTLFILIQMVQNDTNGPKLGTEMHFL